MVQQHHARATQDPARSSGPPGRLNEAPAGSRDVDEITFRNRHRGTLAPTHRAQLAGPLATVAVALLLAGLQHTALYVPNPGAVLVAVVAFAAFRGGVRPGLASATVAVVYAAYFFSTGPRLHGDGLRSLLVVLVTAPAVALITGRLREGLALSAARERAASAEADRASRWLAAIVESSSDAIIAEDLDGTLRSWNAGASRLFGYAAAEAIGRSVTLLVPPELRDEEVAILERLRRGEQVAQLETVRMRKDGRRLDVSLSISPIRDASGRIIGAAKIVRDITEQKRAERAVAERAEHLARSNAELDQFAYVTSHDLRAPLRGITNLTDWIEQDLAKELGAPAPARVREHLAKLRGRVARMDGLINGILQYSRAGRVRERPERVDTGALVAETVELLAPPVGVRVEVAPGMPAFDAERVPLQQVFMNLIANAITHAGRPDVVVRVSAHDLGDDYEFTVSDNGSGIPPKYHERIFGIFQRLSARDKVEGTGIGLSVVKKHVEVRGGRVSVESSEGAGATFRFTWPKATGGGSGAGAGTAGATDVAPDTPPGGSLAAPAASHRTTSTGRM